MAIKDEGVAIKDEGVAIKDEGVAIKNEGGIINVKEDTFTGALSQTKKGNTAKCALSAPCLPSGLNPRQ